MRDAATLPPLQHHLPFGRIDPGAPADLVLLDDLETWDVDRVLVDGEADPTDGTDSPPSSNVATETVDFDPVSASDLAIAVPDAHSSSRRIRVIDAVGGIQTDGMVAEVPVQEGTLVADPDDDLLALAVIERHGGDGGIGRGFVHGLGLDRGAVGSTVAHDAHNCVVAGADHASMATVANELRDLNGGVAAYDPVEDELTAIALPVAGLMSDRPIETVYERYEAVADLAAEIGVCDNGLMELSFLALEVIPKYRLTNRGLVDVEAGEHVDVTL